MAVSMIDDFLSITVYSLYEKICYCACTILVAKLLYNSLCQSVSSYVRLWGNIVFISKDLQQTVVFKMFAWVCIGCLTFKNASEFMKTNLASKNIPKSNFTKQRFLKTNIYQQRNSWQLHYTVEYTVNQRYSILWLKNSGYFY